MSAFKISARRLSDYAGPRRKKPAINRQKRAVLAQLEAEKDLISALMMDAALRRAFEKGSGRPRQPMSVWTDFDHSELYTELGPKHLPKWNNVSEALKMFIAFDLGMEHDACFSVTANLDPDLVEKWATAGSDLMPNIEQRLRRALKHQGIPSLPFAYIVETRTKRGKGASRPHLHGLAICEDAHDATRFKVALERALLPTLLWRGRGKAIQVKRSFDKDADLVGEFTGRGSWISYAVKNAHRYDKRLGKRRVFLSHSLIDLARGAWAVRREE